MNGCHWRREDINIDDTNLNEIVLAIDIDININIVADKFAVNCDYSNFLIEKLYFHDATCSSINF